jgi:hypothetical protein
VVLIKLQVFGDVTSYRLYYREDGGTTLLRNVSTPPNTCISSSAPLSRPHILHCDKIYPVFFRTSSNARWTVILLLCVLFTTVMFNLLGTRAKWIKKNVWGPRHKYSEPRLIWHRFMRLLECNVRYSLVPVNLSLLIVILYCSVRTTLLYNGTEYSALFIAL